MHGEIHLHPSLRLGLISHPRPLSFPDAATGYTSTFTSLGYTCLTQTKSTVESKKKKEEIPKWKKER